jgi:16S rRNA (cytosine1402-N4)-methyltransferase
VHKSVLKKEVLEYLNPRADENFIDATFGEGGHSLSILEKNKPEGKVLGIEINETLYQKASSQKIKRLSLVNDSFTNLKEIFKKSGLKNVSGILFDLGFSSWHLEESEKGFSFLRDEDLDMRYGNSSCPTAKEIINKWPERDIEEILKKYGEERFAGRISREIARRREKKPIETTFQLVEIIKNAFPARYHYQRINFATRTFQALRIAVNDELGRIEQTLPQALEILKKGGRIVVISFHSLEDRIIKNYFRENYKKGLLKILTKKPIRPGSEEIAHNPRSRSAKLRSAEIL